MLKTCMEQNEKILSALKSSSPRITNKLPLGGFLQSPDVRPSLNVNLQHLRNNNASDPFYVPPPVFPLDAKALTFFPRPVRPHFGTVLGCPKIASSSFYRPTYPPAQLFASGFQTNNVQHTNVHKNNSNDWRMNGNNNNADSLSRPALPRGRDKSFCRPTYPPAQLSASGFQTNSVQQTNVQNSSHWRMNVNNNDTGSHLKAASPHDFGQSNAIFPMASQKQLEEQMLKESILKRGEEELKALRICLNCGRKNHQLQNCRNPRVSEMKLKQMVMKARQNAAREVMIKEELRRQAENYKIKREMPLISRLRKSVPDGKITKMVFNFLCDRCSEFGHLKNGCKNEEVDRSIVKSVRDSVNEFTKIFFVYFQEDGMLDLSKKFELFAMMDYIENVGVDPVSLQLQKVCMDGVVTLKHLVLCSNCALLGHKSQGCTNETVSRGYYTKMLQLVGAYRALVKEKKTFKIKVDITSKKEKEMEADKDDDVIIIDDDEECKGQPSSSQCLSTAEDEEEGSIIELLDEDSSDEELQFTTPLHFDHDELIRELGVIDEDLESDGAIDISGVTDIDDFDDVIVLDEDGENEVIECTASGDQLNAKD